MHRKWFKRVGRDRVAGLCLLLVLSALFTAMANALVREYPALLGLGSAGALGHWNAAWNQPYRVLVIYVYSNTDPGQNLTNEGYATVRELLCCDLDFWRFYTTSDHMDLLYM